VQHVPLDMGFAFVRSKRIFVLDCLRHLNDGVLIGKRDVKGVVFKGCIGEHYGLLARFAL